MHEIIHACTPQRRGARFGEKISMWPYGGVPGCTDYSEAVQLRLYGAPSQEGLTLGTAGSRAPFTGGVK